MDDDCGACQLIESLLPLLETLVARQHWDHVVLAAPPAMEARPLASTLVATMPEIAVDTVTCVVDAVLLVEQLSGDELLDERGLARPPGLPQRRRADRPADRVRRRAYSPTLTAALRLNDCTTYWRI